FDQPCVRKFALRILVKHLQVRMSRGGVEIVIELFDVFTMVPLAVREAEEAFLENVVATVPQGQRQAKPATMIADPCQSVLAPAIGPTAGHLVREIIPGVAVGAVVFADGSPLPLRKVRSPVFPQRSADVRRPEPRLLGRDLHSGKTASGGVLG